MAYQQTIRKINIKHDLIHQCNGSGQINTIIAQEVIGYICVLGEKVV